MVPILAATTLRIRARSNDLKRHLLYKVVQSWMQREQAVIIDCTESNERLKSKSRLFPSESGAYFVSRNHACKTLERDSGREQEGENEQNRSTHTPQVPFELDTTPSSCLFNFIQSCLSFFSVQVQRAGSHSDDFLFYEACVPASPGEAKGGSSEYRLFSLLFSLSLWLRPVE
jgi:hypothetical protein